MCRPPGPVIVAVAHEYLSRRTPATRLPRAGGVGYRREAARLAGGGPRGLPAAAGERDFLAVATPGRRQDHLRPADRHRAARPRRHPGRHRGRPHRAPQAPVGRRRRPGRHPAQPGVLQLQRRCSRTSTTGSPSPTPQVASKPQLHRRRTEETPTLVILDEIHHGGDARSWGDGIREAFDGATRRLSLTGTPFRSDTTPIPFVRYEMGEDGILRSASDYSYGYAAALRDGVVRPVLFLAYGGAMRWRTKAGDEVAARLGEPLTKDQTAQAWRTALDPKGEWVPSVLAAADTRLSEVRRHVPDAGGLVIASNQTSARAYARLLRDHHRRGPHRRAVRRRRGQRRHRVVRRGHLAVDGRRADGVRGRRRAAAVRRGLRHVDLDPAVLRAGRRPVRAGPPPRRDRVGLPALGAGHPHPRRDDGGGARPRAEPAVDRRGRGLAVGGGGGAARGGQPHREDRRARGHRVRGAGVRRPLRPRALRRPAVRPARRGGLGGGAGLPRPARACSSPTRSPPCSTSGRRSRPRRRARAAVPRRHPGPLRSRPTGPWPRSARSSTSSSRPTRRRPAARTRASTSSCAGPAAGPSSPPPRASRCSSGWSGSGAGSSAVADPRRAATGRSPIGPSLDARRRRMPG